MNAFLPADILRRLLLLFIVVSIAAGVLFAFTYDVIKINWISFMEIQPSYKPMENPLPAPVGSIPLEGAAYVPGMGAPLNPILSDEISLARGAQLFNLNCSHCHGLAGQGDGAIAALLANKPKDLTSPVVQNLSDGAIFLVISDGKPGRMPALNENLTVRERWDVVNFARTWRER
jgi:mono/diheme cytochrome c family protein